MDKLCAFLTSQFARFLQRLDEMPEADGSVLDHSVILYGSSNSKTHVNTNYPRVLAGGSKLGFTHGQYLRCASSVPMTNMLQTILNRVDVPTDRFVDSTGEMTELTV